MKKGQSLTPMSWCHVALMHIRNDPEYLFFCPTSAVSPSRQTRRMQAETSVRNDASVFLNTTSLLHQVKKPKQCIVMSLESGFMFWKWNLLYLSHFQLSIFVLHSPHSLPFSLSLFLAVPISVLLPIFPPHLSPFLFPRVSSSYSFSFQFPFSLSHLSSLPALPNGNQIWNLLCIIY